MTRPTQAQIEAEEDASLFGSGFIKQLPDGSQERIDPSTVFIGKKAAITAAAEVKEPLPSVNWNKEGKPFSYCPECGRSEPITAAAEVGREQRIREDDAWMNASISATIERCAQVVRKKIAECEIPFTRVKLLEAETEIRALKDSK